MRPSFFFFFNIIRLNTTKKMRRNGIIFVIVDKEKKFHILPANETKNYVNKAIGGS